MLKFENTVTPPAEQWVAVIMGARNPLESWDRSDSEIKLESWHDTSGGYCQLGHNDLDLMMRLRNAGTDHRKFLRMLPVVVTITGPLYWWKEFDTYKVGTVANSCSTMHYIHKKPFTMDDFSYEHLNNDSLEILKDTINLLNAYRTMFVAKNDKQVDQYSVMSDECYTRYKKKLWWQMIQLLPSSYNQKRTVMLNYEVLANIYKSRKDHKLDEWREFCKWIETLPYSELITGDIS